MRKVKVKKLTGWDKDSLIGKLKAAHTSKAKQAIHHFHGNAGAQPSPRQQGSLGRQALLLPPSPAILFHPALYAEYDVIRYGISLGSFPPPPPSLVG